MKHFRVCLTHNISTIVTNGDQTDTLEILKAKKGGNYAVIKIDPDYVPEQIEKKQVFGVTFEQGHNFIEINDEMFSNIVTDNKDLPESALIDLKIALITLKYTQSNA